MPVVAFDAAALVAVIILLLFLLLYFYLLELHDSIPDVSIIGINATGPIKDGIQSVANWILSVAETVINWLFPSIGHYVVWQGKWYIDNERDLIKAEASAVQLLFAFAENQIKYQAHELTAWALDGELAYYNYQINALWATVQGIQSGGSGIGNAAWDLANQAIAAVQALDGRVSARLNQDEAYTQGWIQNLVISTNNLAAYMQSVNNYVAALVQQGGLHLAADIADITARITNIGAAEAALQQGVDGVRGRIRVVEEELAKALPQIANDAATLAKLASLIVIAELGAAAISNLVRLGRNPCLCLDVGGGFDWIAPVVAALATDMI